MTQDRAFEERIGKLGRILVGNVERAESNIRELLDIAEKEGDDEVKAEAQKLRIQLDRVKQEFPAVFSEPIVPPPEHKSDD